MPYKRKFKKSYKKADNCLVTANQALRIAKWVKERINAEKLLVDTEQNTDPDTTGTVTSLVDCAQGDAQNNRHGSSIKACSLSGKIQLVKNTATTWSTVRALVVQDMQQVSDTDPTISQVLESATTDAFLQSENLGRFKVLMDRVVQLNANKPNVLLRFNKKLNHHIRYNGSAAGDVEKGGIYFMIFSNEATNTPFLDSTWRLRYYDN